MSEPKVWDYREPRWGWAAHLIKTPDGGDTWSVSTGYGAGLREGDIIIVATGPATGEGVAGARPYRLQNLAYDTDPPDLWTAELHGAEEHAAREAG